MDGLLDLISCERRGESISRSMLAGLVRMLCQLKIYHTDFEALFLEVCCHCGCDGIITCSDKPLAQESAKFYRQEGQQRMESADVRCSNGGALQPRSKRWFAPCSQVAQYLRHVQRRLNEEVSSLVVLP